VLSLGSTIRARRDCSIQLRSNGTRQGAAPVVAAKAVRAWLHALACNPIKSMQMLALTEVVKQCSLAGQGGGLVKIDPVHPFPVGSPVRARTLTLHERPNSRR
jgi:hypothetical protein